MAHSDSRTRGPRRARSSVPPLPFPGPIGVRLPARGSIWSTLDGVFAFAVIALMLSAGLLEVSGLLLMAYMLIRVTWGFS